MAETAAMSATWKTSAASLAAGSSAIPSQNPADLLPDPAQLATADTTA